MTNHDDLVRKNTRTGLILMAVIASMVALSFISVPLYKRFCQLTGFNGTPVTGGVPDQILKREVTVEFNADTAPGMGWDFKPEKPSIKIHIGQKALISFTAHSRLNAQSAGTALYNVNPPKVGRYFHKLQCFCFDKQVLAANQRADLPVVFYVDPAMAADPDMADVNSITLSYTFFPADSKALDVALKRFYNSGEPVINRSK